MVSHAEKEVVHGQNHGPPSLQKPLPFPLYDPPSSVLGLFLMETSGSQVQSSRKMQGIFCLALGHPEAELPFSSHFLVLGSKPP